MSDPYAQQQPAAVPPVAPAVPVAEQPGPKGIIGMFRDPSTLASTGLLTAVAFAVVAGLFAMLDGSLGGDIRDRLLALTSTVDIGDVAILGIAVALLLLTPDPPGGVSRPLLLQLSAVLSGVIMIFELIRAFVVLAQEGDALGRIGGFVATLGVAIAAFTMAFYAAKESFLKEAQDEAQQAA